ncbi:MAG: hydrogenase expression/formation protein HypE [Elusimicrobiota bacterium]
MHITGMKDKFITKKHGYGGKKSRSLVEEYILPEVDNIYADKMDDSAELSLDSKNIVFSTDSYVVKPYSFSGGNIGKLAVSGTINDIVAQGGVPKYLSAAIIVEEGFLIEDFQEIVKSAATEAKKNSTEIVCGDMKVVEKGAADGIYINTSGIGEQVDGIFVKKPKIGDLIVVTGPIGEHGATVFQERNKILTSTENIRSDCRGLGELSKIVKDFSEDIKFMRDPTRGGLAGVLLEFAGNFKRQVNVEAAKTPVKNWVKGFSYITGIDYFYLACEGRMVLVINKKTGNKFVEALKKNNFHSAAVIGKITDSKTGVTLNTKSGGRRILNFRDIAQIPRIC